VSKDDVRNIELDIIQAEQMAKIKDHILFYIGLDGGLRILVTLVISLSLLGAILVKSREYRG
jgi:hypothetical protein